MAINQNLCTLLNHSSFCLKYDEFWISEFKYCKIFFSFHDLSPKEIIVWFPDWYKLIKQTLDNRKKVKGKKYL